MRRANGQTILEVYAVSSSFSPSNEVEYEGTCLCVYVFDDNVSYFFFVQFYLSIRVLKIKRRKLK